MAYSTEAEVQVAAGGEARLVQLTDWDETDAVDSARVLNAIEAADAKINSYVGRRLSTPLSVVPNSIKWLSAQLAVLQLKRWRRMFSDDDELEMQEHTNTLVALANGPQIADETQTPLTKSERLANAASDRESTKDVTHAKLKGFW